MERFVVGDVVVTPFPFSDLTSSIKRPVLIVATLHGDDLIVCQITTKERKDPFEISLSPNDFIKGNLKINSFIRSGKLLTIKSSRILYKIGTLKKEKINETNNKIIEIFNKSLK